MKRESKKICQKKKNNKKTGITIKKRYLCYRRDLTSKSWSPRFPQVVQSGSLAVTSFWVPACDLREFVRLRVVPLLHRL